MNEHLAIWRGKLIQAKIDRIKFLTKVCNNGKIYFRRIHGYNIFTWVKMTSQTHYDELNKQLGEL